MLPTARTRRYPVSLGSAFPAGVGVTVQGVKEAARLEHQNNMVPRRDSRLRILKCFEASERDDTEENTKWQIQIKSLNNSAV